MEVTLRIVGIFYKVKFEIEAEKVTVKDVLMEAMRQQPLAGANFSFARTITGGFESPSLFQVEYDNDRSSPSSGRTYPAGIYQLGENLTQRPAYTVWQYYIVNKQGVVLNRGKGFVAYDNPDEETGALVEDEQTVIWRLLTICDEPTTRNPRLDQMFAMHADGGADA